MTDPRTIWRLLALPDHAFPLDVDLVVDTTAPAVVESIEEAARDNGLTLERVAGGDPRFGEPVGENEIAGLAVAFKALVVRAGGRVEITEGELLHARTLLARVDADPETMVVEVVDGAPPETPRFEAEPVSDWLDELAPAERDNFDKWVDHVRRDAIVKMADSAFVASLVPAAEPDVEFAVELGLAIMLDKPILAIVMPGRPVPERLRRVADRIVQVDIDTEEGRAELQREIASFMTEVAP